jgi:GH24 family phage-related lysozyme (muramidase)
MTDATLEELVFEELDGDEGNKLRAYDDANPRALLTPGYVIQGKITIGRGRNLVDRGITEEESRQLLENDIAAAIAALDLALPWLRDESPRRQAALICLYFNVDEGNVEGFEAKWPNFIRQMAGQDYSGAAANLKNSHPWVDEVGVGRASRMAQMILAG